VDRPTTAEEIDVSVDECAKLQHEELHMLGWDWETRRSAGRKGVKLRLLQIPREVMEPQAAQKGDVRFFPLAYLGAEIRPTGDLTARVALTNFAIPDAEPLPGWADYIDYWAVDWDFRNDIFTQGWAAYRTRKEKNLPLISGPHTYEKAGGRRILVRVIDIFGNETRQVLDQRPLDQQP
jgi:hypothetical protein